MFSVTVAVVVSTLLLAAVVLAVPVLLVFEVERTARRHAHLRVQWLFGLLDLEVRARPPRRSESVRPVRASSAKRASRREGGRGKRSVAVALAVLRTKGLVARVARLIRDLVRQFGFEAVSVRIELGLDDPADTGRLYGVVAPLVVAAASWGVDVECQPAFQEAGLRGSCAGRIRMRPLAVLMVLVGFLFSAPALRAARAAWLARS